MRNLRILPIGAAFVAFPLLAACSASVSVGDDEDDFDRSAFERRAIAEMNSDYAGIGRTVSSLDCDYPDSIETGSTFVCIADVDGAKVNTDITVTENSGFDLKSTDLVFDMENTAQKLAQPVADKLGGSITVNCGTGVKALPPDSSFTCSVINGAGGTQTLTYYVTEGSANDRWEVE